MKVTTNHGNHVQVTEEEQVFDAVMTWLRHDTKRAQFTYELLSLVRLPLLSKEFIVDIVSCNSVPYRFILDIMLVIFMFISSFMCVLNHLSLACRFEYIVCTFLYTVYDAFSATE